MLLSPSKKIVGKEKGGRLSEEDEPNEMGGKFILVRVYLFHQ
jgi:hypothetical protein